MLKKISFIIAILGISVLLAFLILSPVEIENLEDLESLEINEKVFLRGVVEDSKVFDDFVVLKIKGMDVLCDCEEEYLGKDLEVEGVIDEFNGKKQIRVLRILTTKI